LNYRVRHENRPVAWRLLSGMAVMLLCMAAAADARTLTMTLAGEKTLVDITEPTGPAGATSSRDAVILAHGFTRTRATFAGHAAMLARAGYWAIVPDLPFLLDSRDNAVALRDLIRQLQQDAAQAPLDRFVLVGFSAGGLSALLAADAPGVVGYIGLDPFDRPNGVGLEAARKLAVPAFLLRGPSAACNAYSIAEPWVKALPNLVQDRQIAAASHCDFESPTDGLCTFVCGDTNPQNQSAVGVFLLESVRRAMPPLTSEK
jgi:pimeloyl-ACP methyl ester carboxylesterase